MAQAEDEAWLRELNDDLRRIGRLPRILTLILALVSLPIVWIGWMNTHYSPVAFAFAAVPIALLRYALPVRAWATADSLTPPDRSALRGPGRELDEQRDALADGPVEHGLRWSVQTQ